MDFRSTMSVTANSIFFSNLHNTCLPCLFSERDTVTTWKCWAKIHIYIHTHSDRAQHFWKPGRLPYTSGKKLEDLGKHHHFGLSCQRRNDIQLQQWTKHHYLGYSCWVTRLPSCQKSTSTQTHQLRCSQNAESIQRHGDPFAASIIFPHWHCAGLCRLMEVWHPANLTFFRHEIFER